MPQVAIPTSPRTPWRHFFCRIAAAASSERGMLRRINDRQRFIKTDFRDFPDGIGRLQEIRNKKSGQLFRIVRRGSGRRTRTSDLRVMSPTSCQLLHPAIYLRIIIYRFCVCKDNTNFRILQIFLAAGSHEAPYRPRCQRQKIYRPTLSARHFLTEGPLAAGIGACGNECRPRTDAPDRTGASDCGRRPRRTAISGYGRPRSPPDRAPRP